MTRPDSSTYVGPSRQEPASTTQTNTIRRHRSYIGETAQDICLHLNKSQRGSVALLCSFAALYCVVEWLGASNISGNRIFSKLRNSDRANFDKMLLSVSAMALQSCTGLPNAPDMLLFDDSDVATPYLVRADRIADRCKVTRETTVTPFTDAEKKSCRAILIQEFSPPHPPRQENPGLPVYARWRSAENRFGYTAFHQPCTPSRD